jgi:hypothetical protein
MTETTLTNPLMPIFRQRELRFMRGFDWCRTNRHRPIVDQHLLLSAKMQGHYA